MNVLNAQQIREWDQYTILNEPIASVDLMERAAVKCIEWIVKRNWQDKTFHIFCGKGNNGGDGLAIARILLQSGYKVSVCILEFGKIGSEDFQANLQKLHDLPITIHFIQDKENFPEVFSTDIIIEALYGSGLNKPLDGLSALLVEFINQSKATVVSIDIPAGLFIDRSSKGNKIICASYTLTFQCYKLALLVQENAPFFGQVVVLDIGLHPDFLLKNNEQRFVEPGFIKKIFKPRNPFAHKGNFGHALLIAGSFGKMGAAVLAAKSCLHSGVGLLTCHIPACGYGIMQTSVPEAMVITDNNYELVAQLPDEIEKYSVIGIGPGIGTAEETQNLLSFSIRRYHKPLVIDADGLNCFSLQRELLGSLPAQTVLTPHPKEFDRLFGEHDSDFDRIAKAKLKAKEMNLVVMLKGHHTLIATPSGASYFNSTGNAGLAKGGTGDVLTGIITALVAQGYDTSMAAVLGTYLHGYAGDIAANTLSMETMTATDIITFLSPAFKSISG